MDPRPVVLYGLLLPVAVAAAILAAGRSPRRGAAAVLAGALAGQVALVGLPPLPPREALHYLPVAGILGLLWGLARGERPARLAGLPLAALLGAVLALALTAPLRQHRWDAPTAAGWVGALALGQAALWGLLAAAEARRPRAAAGALAGVSLASAVALAGSGSLVLGQLALAAAAAVGAVALATVLQPTAGLLRTALPTSTLMLGTLLASGVLFSSLPPASAILLALAGAGAWAGAAGLAATAGAAGLAVVLTFRG